MQGGRGSKYDVLCPFPEIRNNLSLDRVYVYINICDFSIFFSLEVLAFRKANIENKQKMWTLWSNWPIDPNSTIEIKKFLKNEKKILFISNVVQLETFPCGYWKTQEYDQNVPIFEGGEGGKINKKCPYFFCPYSRRGGGVKWEKDNVPLYELFFFWRHP